ncbi:MAG: TonB-dependent receptor [Sedimentisphaerales bacterium]|nr:TonB-dependent receptor [Sedimentisphaerales bacterium]
MKYGFYTLFVLIWLHGLSFITLAEVKDEPSLLDMSIEELMEVPIVSASRSEQTSSELSVPVGVLTAEEIRNSGLTTIPELLALIPGVDVRRLDRTRYIVGVRGMLGTYSDRTLVLINGRSALNPAWGAPDWQTLPVMVADIERIEVVRGPGGAVWGANAFTGVINIITKKPEDTTGGLVSSTFTEFGDGYTQLRYGESEEALSWRVSAGYEDIKNSDHAGAGKTVSAFPTLDPLMGFSTFEARDFARVFRLDSELAYQQNEDTRLNFGVGHTSLERGDRELSGQLPNENGLASMTRIFGRIDRSFDPDTSGYLQWFGNYSVVHPTETIERYGFYENDLEGQLQFPAGEAHQLTVGGNLRWTHISGERNDAGYGVYYAEGGYDEYWAGIYLVDRYKMSERFTLESQGRLDRYNKSGTDWSMRIAGLYALDDEKNHVVRAGVARSFRTPGVMLRELRMTSLGGLFNVIQNAGEVDNESTYALEAGYVGKLSNRVMVRIDSYYQRMEHLLGSVNQMAGPVTNSFFDNLDGANAYGGEFELSYKKGRYNLSSWYAYNELVTDKNDDAVRAYFPARHKVGARYNYRLQNDWLFQANYTYNDKIHINASNSPSDETPVSHRLDLTFSRKLFEGNTEILFGVADVLNETNGPVYDVSYFTSYETPGRMFFMNIIHRF